MVKIKLTNFKSPTSLSIFPERSPQHDDKPNIFNAFTTKNVMVRNMNGQQWNTVKNNKLAYKRSARGAHIGSYPKIVYGPTVEILTTNNYKKLKKGTKLYYDRGSSLFRGPFTYQKTLRGPNLLLTVGDIAYKDNIYKFIIPINKLKKELLYFETKRRTKSKTKRKTKHKRKTKSKNKHKTKSKNSEKRIT